MKVNQLATKQNLTLAWRRITTGGNHQYKRLYRQIYLAYEVALDANLRDLRQRLLGGSFQPNHPERIYIPKPSGLHRPLTLLSIEDQIVFQAFANLAAKRVQVRRAPLQSKTVFSNILQDPASIFFFRQWQETYAAFQERIRAQFEAGNHWVGDFDLAAFYDTISHELLLRTIYPRANGTDSEFISTCLRTWSSDRAASGHGHGLPQGPLASDFLAECFLLPIDIALQSRKGYVRYVDDVRLFGSSEDMVRSDLIVLEQLCRERGLIPQIGKFAIKRASSVEDAMGMLPSISDPQHTEGKQQTFNSRKASRMLRSAIGGKPTRVIDKTRLRYVLYRAEPDSDVIRVVLRLIPRHPEHTDAFFAYLGRFGYRKSIERVCLDLIERSPYAYVRGEAWHVIARFCRHSGSKSLTSIRRLTNRAVTVARTRGNGRLYEKWGACHLLCVSEELTGIRVSRFLKHQPPLLQSLLVPVLPETAYGQGEAVHSFLGRSQPEPGLSVVASLHARGVDHSTYGLREDQLPSQVVNALRELGMIAGKGQIADPIEDILRRRYRMARGARWRTLLGGEYLHVLGLLKQAESAFSAGPSSWLAFQNSFNNAVFLALQRHFQATGHAGACTTADHRGQLVDFGVMLDVNGPFARECPRIATGFRAINARRNSLPVAHPYEKKTAAKTRYLKGRERDQLARRLGTAYGDLIALIP